MPIAVRARRDPTFLETADAARYLKVTPAMVRVYADTGRLRVAMRTARGTRLFDSRDVERFARERTAAREGAQR